MLLNRVSHRRVIPYERHQAVGKETGHCKDLSLTTPSRSLPATLLQAELKSGGRMGQLCSELLTQVLVIHLLRHYSTFTQTITSENSSLTQAQLQQAIDYIHTHLGQDLSLVQIAKVINLSPTYFASLFKRATGISPHQYVIKQRVEQAKLLLSQTDLTIAAIALQVGFSSQSHLTQQFKRITRMTPKQVR